MIAISILLAVATIFLGFPVISAVGTPSFDRIEAGVVQAGLVISNYFGSADLKRTGDTEGSVSLDLTCQFEVFQQCRPDSWSVSNSSMKATYAELDGRPVNVENKYGSFKIAMTQDLNPGIHRLKLKYNCTMNIFSPDRAKVQIFIGSNHFHLSGNWFQAPNSSYSWAAKTRFSITLSTPKDWLAIGFGDMQTADSPKPDGKYSINLETSDPMLLVILGGKYTVDTYPVKDAKLRVYSLPDSKSDKSSILTNAKSICDFYESYFGKPASGNFFVAETTGYKGLLVDCTGGMAVDSEVLAQGLKKSLLASNLSKMAWLGGNGIVGSDKLPDSKIFDRSFPLFASLLYCKSICPQHYSCSEWENMLGQYCKNRNPSDAPITDPAGANCSTSIEYRAPLALYALRNFVGDDILKKTMKDFVNRYSLNIQTKARQKPDFADFKRAVERAYGKPLDDFWNQNFRSNQTLDISYGIIREIVDGAVVEKAYAKSNLAPAYPLSFRIFYADGQFEDITLESVSAEKVLDKPAGGVEFIDYYKIIPEQNLPLSTMSTSTIEAACAWRNPIVANLDEDNNDRAKMLCQRFDAEPTVGLPAKLPSRPVIVTGRTAIRTLGQNVMKGMPISWDNGIVSFNGTILPGSFQTLMLIGDPENSNTPIILDTGLDDIPAICDKAAYFKSDDGRLEFCVRTFDQPAMSVSQLQLLTLLWTTFRNSSSGSRYDFPATDLEGCTAYYNGFDSVDFVFKPMVVKLFPDNPTPVLLDFQDGKATVTITRKSWLLDQIWKQELTTSKVSDITTESIGLSVPASVAGDTVDIKWNSQLGYLANVDGKTIDDWKNDSKFSLNGLPPGKHFIKLVFIGLDGMISKVIKNTVVTGAKPPTLIFTTKKALYRDGKITISGRTDPDCMLEPPGSINQDGTFTISLPANVYKPLLTVTSTSKLGLTVTVTVPVAKNTRINMQIGSTTATDESGNAYILQVPPQIIDGMTYVPMRFIGERLGAQILWDDSTRKVTYIIGAKIVEITIGKPEAIIDGSKTKMPGPAIVVNGKTLVPVRFVAEALGAKVEYESSSGTITIDYLTE